MTKIHWDRLNYPWSYSKDPVKFWLSVGGLGVFLFSFAVLHSISLDLGLTPKNVGGQATQYPAYYDPNSPIMSGQYFGYRSQDYYSPSQYGYYQQSGYPQSGYQQSGYAQAPIYYGNNQYGGYPNSPYGAGYNQYQGQYPTQGAYNPAQGYGPMYSGYDPMNSYYNPRGVPVFQGIKAPSQASYSPPTQGVVEEPYTPQPPQEQPLADIQIERSNSPPPNTVFEPSAAKKKTWKLSPTFLYIVLVLAILIWLYLIYVMFKPKSHPAAPSKPLGIEHTPVKETKPHNKPRKPRKK